MSTNKFIAAAVVAAALLTGAGALAQTTSSMPAPAANEINYVSQLPTPSELSRAQPPAGARIARIRQTNAEITATYVYANGQAQVVTYRLLGTVAGATPAAPASPTTVVQPATVVQPQPTAVIQSGTVVQPTAPPPVYYYDAPPAVVYQEGPPVYYQQPAYYPYYPWFPLSLGFNFGFHGGGFRGGFGGFRGGFRR